MVPPVRQTWNLIFICKTDPLRLEVREALALLKLARAELSGGAGKRLAKDLARDVDEEVARDRGCCSSGAVGCSIT
jgi:hypothetical protein